MGVVGLGGKCGRLCVSKEVYDSSWGGSRESTSFSARMLPKLINGVFFSKKNFYRKVTFKNYVNLFLKFKIVSTQLIM